MTDKYTREQKIARLQELLPYMGKTSVRAWITAMEMTNDSYEDFITAHNHEVGQATWDVHTGVAFTPLYKVMK